MPALVKFRRCPELARQVAALRRLDLDHIGAEQRQLIAAVRAGQHVGQIEDADAGKQAVMVLRLTTDQASPGTCSGPRRRRCSIKAQ